jgi:hypothetical protein
MKRMQLVLLDDKHFADTGELALADETLSFALDGTGYELDLAAGNAAKLRRLLEPWIAAAHPPGEEPLPPGAPPPAGLRAAIARGRALRRYVDDNRIRARAGRDRPAYETPGGKFYVPAWLRQEFSEAQKRAAGNGTGTREDSGASV